MGNPNYCTLAEAHETAAKLKDIGGGVKYIYLPFVHPNSPWDVNTDPQDAARKQYEYIMGNGNAEQSAGIWTYLFSRPWMPDWLVRMVYGGAVEPGNGFPVTGIAWKEQYRG